VSRSQLAILQVYLEHQDCERICIIMPLRIYTKKVESIPAFQQLPVPIICLLTDIVRWSLPVRGHSLIIAISNLNTREENYMLKYSLYVFTCPLWFKQGCRVYMLWSRRGHAIKYHGSLDILMPADLWFWWGPTLSTRAKYFFIKK
jgi:hypothetical protein